jgi:hypothetical protein
MVNFDKNQCNRFQYSILPYTSHPPLGLLWVKEGPSVIFAALTLESREKSTIFQIQFLKGYLNPLSNFQGPVLAHNFAIPIFGVVRCAKNLLQAIGERRFICYFGSLNAQISRKEDHFPTTVFFGQSKSDVSFPKTGRLGV